MVSCSDKGSLWFWNPCLRPISPDSVYSLCDPEPQRLIDLNGHVSRFTAAGGKNGPPTGDRWGRSESQLGCLCGLVEDLGLSFAEPLRMPELLYHVGFFRKNIMPPRV